MSIDVFGADEQHDREVPLSSLVGLLRSALEAEGVRGGAEVSLLFVDRETIADLNERFLGKPGPTDVLSFPLEDDPTPGGRAPDAGGAGPGEAPEPEVPDLLGDVVLCPDVAYENAEREGVDAHDEMALLVVHGALHLLGWDHIIDAEAERMEAREDEILRAHWSSSWTRK